MYSNTTVKIPELKGKIFFKPHKSTQYVQYQYGSEYKPDKKYAIPHRTIIGKVCQDDNTLMYPNEKYKQYFPDVEVVEELPAAYRSCSLKIGPYAIINKIIEEYGLYEMLMDQFGKNTGLILDLVSFLIVEENNAGQYYPNYAFNHPLFTENMRIYSDSKVSRLLNNEITKDQCIGFLNEWNKNRDHTNRIYISYDSTNKNCDAGDISIVEFGKAKDEKGLPVFNVSIAMDKTNRVPLFYEEYPGSITDISQFPFLVDKVNEYGYKKIGFILDRGYFSKENIQYLDDNNYSFVIMCKGCKELVSSLVLSNRNSFESSRDCFVSPYKVYGKTVTAKLYKDDKKDRFFHIFFSSAKFSAERMKLENKLEEYKKFLEKNIGNDIQFGPLYTDYFQLYYNNGVLCSVKERTDAIERELQLCGYFCLITSEEMTAAQALIHYKGRDISEKLFRADKSFLGSRSERIHSSQSMSSKLFIEFIALIIRNRIYNLLKEQMIRSNKKFNFMTVPAAISELEKIEMVRINNGNYKLDHAVTKTQRIILSSFGMGKKNIIEISKEISNTLANSKDFTANEEQSDAEEENN